MCPLRNVPCILCCHSPKHWFSPYKKDRKKKDSSRRPFTHLRGAKFVPKKQKCVTTELRCHYLATKDHGATFFLCLLHCSQKHAHCLFGVEWPIENTSCREKGMLLISPWIILLFYYSKSSPNEPHLFVQPPGVEQESATFPSKSTGNKEGSAGRGLHRNHLSLRGERK